MIRNIGSPFKTGLESVSTVSANQIRSPAYQMNPNQVILRSDGFAVHPSLLERVESYGSDFEDLQPKFEMLVFWPRIRLTRQVVSTKYIPKQVRAALSETPKALTLPE